MTDRSRRRPWLAALLAFVVSGLGHAYLRRWARAFLWYAAVTGTLLFLVPEAAVEGLLAGERPPLADIGPAVVVVAASVIDAYVLARRNNRAVDREQRAVAATAGAAGPSTEERAATRTPDQPDRPSGDDGGSPDEVSCPHCGRATDPSFGFCQWCAEPIGDR